MFAVLQQSGSRKRRRHTHGRHAGPAAPVAHLQRPTPAAAGAAAPAAWLWQRLREDCQDSEQPIVKDPLIQCSSTGELASGTWKLTHIGIICRFGVMHAEHAVEQLDSFSNVTCTGSQQGS